MSGLSNASSSSNMPTPGRLGPGQGPGQGQGHSSQPRSARSGRARSHAEELSPVVASMSQFAASTGLAKFLWAPASAEPEGDGSTTPLAGGGDKPAATGEGVAAASAVTGGGVSPALASPAVAAKPGRQPGARFALLILTCINLLNYIDRCVSRLLSGGDGGGDGEGKDAIMNECMYACMNYADGLIDRLESTN
jgi:hypothetical protein